MLWYPIICSIILVFKKIHWRGLFIHFSSIWLSYNQDPMYPMLYLVSKMEFWNFIGNKQIMHVTWDIVSWEMWLLWRQKKWKPWSFITLKVFKIQSFMIFSITIKSMNVMNLIGWNISSSVDITFFKIKNAIQPH